MPQHPKPESLDFLLAQICKLHHARAHTLLEEQGYICMNQQEERSSPHPGELLKRIPQALRFEGLWATLS